MGLDMPQFVRVRKAVTKYAEVADVARGNGAQQFSDRLDKLSSALLTASASGQAESLAPVAPILDRRVEAGQAPGGGAAVYPEGTGLRVRPGSKLVQQMHYNTLGGGGADRTVMDLRVETTPQGWADIQPWTDVRWVLGAGMDIPANTQGVSHEFRYLAGAGDRFAFHNAALHIVNKDCRITQILDIEDIENAHRKIQSLL
jgi:hypothetical protein